MKLLTGLFRAARKRVQTTDNDMGMFRSKLTELVEKKAELPDEEVAKRVDELKEMTVDLPESEDKSKLDLFLEDFKSIKEQDDAAAKEAASMVSDLFEKLDTEAMKDMPGEATEEPAAEEATEEAVEETATEEAPLTESAAPEAETEEATEAVEETVAPKEEATDSFFNSLSSKSLINIKYVICSITVNGLVIPLDQNISHMPCILFLSSVFIFHSSLLIHVFNFAFINISR